jgi:hypothetical protein
MTEIKEKIEIDKKSTEEKEEAPTRAFVGLGNQGSFALTRGHLLHEQLPPGALHDT